jgi:predicted ATPase
VHHSPDPQPTTRPALTGRDTELAQLDALLAASRLVTLTGPAGVGKTALARACTALTSRATVVSLDMLDLPEQVPGRLAAGLVTTAERPMLVLDACEGAGGVSARLAGSLLAAVPSLRIVATGRERLGIPGEVVLPVGPLKLPPPGRPLDGGRRSAAAELLARRSGPEFTLGNGREEEAGALCRALGGLPLAIELAARLTGSMPLAELHARIEADPLGMLVSGEPGDGAMGTAQGTPGHPRHASMLASIGWSHQLCQPAERLLWARLSVFAGEISYEAAEYVCADSHLRPAGLRDLLHRLEARSVLLADDRTDGTYWRLPVLYRAYGRRWLTRLGEDASLVRRHALYTRTLVPGT